MPPPIPDRYQLEVRIGRDEDLEQWLATDTTLDRPVLLRILGPEAGDERRHRFLAAVRAASRVNHSHLAAVYTAHETEHGMVAVAEWVGGMTIADRITSGQGVEPDDFIQKMNASWNTKMQKMETNCIVSGLEKGFKNVDT